MVTVGEVSPVRIQMSATEANITHEWSGRNRIDAPLLLMREWNENETPIIEKWTSCD
jgi:hypothetical protein